MALPTITASETLETAAASAAVLMPKPTPMGKSETFLIVATLVATSSTFSTLEPVTPLSDT